MDFDDYETLPTKNVGTHMTAGAVAGVMEHCVMYPLDSVKTRMQNLSPSPNAVYRGVGEALFRMVKNEGVLRPVRGMSAVVLGAGPAHALYFSSYEYLKDIFTHKSSLNNHIGYGAAGCVATLLHDGIMNPAEVVKQRLQMYNSPYKSCLDCAVKVFRAEGANAFYRSYTTQLTMNVPFQSVHFMTYELMQGITNPERHYNPKAHMASGAIAGAFAAAITTPLDVCKTLLNTQPEAKGAGLFHAFRTVYKLGGITGYFRGLRARVLYQMPSTAICWTMYEFFKYFIAQRTGEAGLTLESSGKVVSSLPLHLMVPQAALAPENSEVSLSEKSQLRTHDEKISTGSNSGSHDSWESWNGSGSSIQAKARELPSVSGAGLYGALSFNTVHGAEGNIGKGSSFLDVSHS